MLAILEDVIGCFQASADFAGEASRDVSLIAEEWISTRINDPRPWVEP